jgi:hypothetical protein
MNALAIGTGICMTPVTLAGVADGAGDGLASGPADTRGAGVA